MTRNAAGQVTTDEWGRYCEGPANRVYPYGNTYQPDLCNGSDFDAGPTSANEDLALATPAVAGCVTADGAFDMGGNVKEWVNDPRVLSIGTRVTLRGGSYETHAPGLTCDFDVRTAPAEYRAPNVGF